MHQPIRVEYSCEAEIAERNNISRLAGQWWALLYVIILCVFFYSGETKLRRIVSNSIVLPVRATYIVRLQFDSVFKDVSCEVDFLEDSIKCSLVLGNTHKKEDIY